MLLADSDGSYYWLLQGVGPSPGLASTGHTLLQYGTKPWPCHLPLYHPSLQPRILLHYYTGCPPHKILDRGCCPSHALDRGCCLSHVLDWGYPSPSHVLDRDYPSPNHVVMYWIETILALVMYWIEAAPVMHMM